MASKSETSVEKLTTEIYCYKVVYPHGAFIRVSPAVDAAKTGAMLEYGAVFESSKSLFLDGINYVKLDDGRGWVFGSKGNTQVLDLIEVCRKQNSKEVAEYRMIECKMKSRPSSSARAQNLYWRDIRTKATSCSTFSEFSTLSCDGITARPPSIPEPGPARSAWMAESGNTDIQVRKCISLIASTTTKGAHSVSNTSDLEALLWVLVHMGGQIGHIMDLVVNEANLHFEQLTPVRRAELLSVALEVGAATRTHSIELSRHADILADDVRNFIQRWVIIKAYKICDDSDVAESALQRPVSSSKGSMELKLGSPHTVTAVVSDDDDESSSDERVAPAFSASSSSKPARMSAAADGQRINSRGPVDDRSNSTGAKTSSADRLPVATSSWLSSWVCSSAPPLQRSDEKRQAVPATATARFSQASSSFLGDVEAYLRRISTDPEFQFAGII